LFVSLVVGTVGRTEEVSRLLDSLARQTCQRFEVIIVDQNPDGRLEDILHRYAHALQIAHVRTECRGLSRARNIGIQSCVGDVLGFPDDDCWYSPSAVDYVISAFRRNPSWDGLSGQVRDAQGQASAARQAKRSQLVDRRNAWHTGSSVSLFVRREVALRLKGFEEQLGVGAGTPWGAGEETDFILRGLDRGFLFYYDSMLTVFHPQSVTQYGRLSWGRARQYGAGIGRVMRRHRYPARLFVLECTRSAFGSVIALAGGHPGKARYYLSALAGKLLGWFSGE